MPGWIDLRVDVIKNGMEKMNVDHPMFKPGYMDPDFSNYVVLKGTPLTRMEPNTTRTPQSACVGPVLTPSTT